MLVQNIFLATWIGTKQLRSPEAELMGVNYPCVLPKQSDEEIFHLIEDVLKKSIINFLLH